MACRILVDGPPNMHFYHSQQSAAVYLPRFRPLIAVTLSSRELAELRIDGLIDLFRDGMHFFFLGHYMAASRGGRDGKERVEVSGYYDASKRRGHLNDPQDDDIRVGLLRAKTHHSYLAQGDWAIPSIVDRLRSECENQGLDPRIADLIIMDLGLVTQE